MGIKGLFGEIGEGERISLSKLSITSYEKNERPLRIAVDVAIWQFQIQAGKGGSDPATRTLYYRLLRLLSSTIQPLFVFDGPNKPPLKRNKETKSGSCSVSNIVTKQLLDLFGFSYHDAPGEAEAECALLQQRGVVDAIFSEDVDTLMFGSSFFLRNWSSEGVRGNKSPTHVSAYYSKKIKEESGLDREGMILIALMSGGDYIPEGIPGCGIKLACEAAKAGFGKSLCNIERSDNVGYDIWKKKLAHEIATNESKFFRNKRKLKLPDDFPNREVLGFYTHPVVSGSSKIEKLEKEIQWDGKVNVMGLRQFVAVAFGWTYELGAKKFIRGLAPALLVHKLRLRGEEPESNYDDILLSSMNELELVQQICGNRIDASTDGMPELRLEYQPLTIVGLDLEAEKDSQVEYCRNGLAPRNNDGDAIEEYTPHDCDETTIQTKQAYTYDPTKPDKIWVARTIARLGVPLKVEDYEESIRKPPRTFVRKINGKIVTTTKGESQSLAKQNLAKSNGCLRQTRNSETQTILKRPEKATTRKSIKGPKNKSTSIHDALCAEEIESFSEFKAPTIFHEFESLGSSLDSSILSDSAFLVSSSFSSGTEKKIELLTSARTTRGKGTNDHAIFQPSTPSLKCSKLRKYKQVDGSYSEMEAGSCSMYESENHLTISNQIPAEQANDHPSYSPGNLEPKQRVDSSSSITFGLENLTLRKKRKYKNEAFSINSQNSQAPIVISSPLTSPNDGDLSDQELNDQHQGIDKFNFPSDFGNIPFWGNTKKIENQVLGPDLPSNFGKIPLRKKSQKTQNRVPSPDVPSNFGKIQFKNQKNVMENRAISSDLPSDFGKIPFGKKSQKTQNRVPGPDLPSNFGKITLENEAKRDKYLGPNSNTHPKEHQKHSKKIIILRESLPGGWKTINENEQLTPAQSKGNRDGSLDKSRTQELARKDKRWRMSEIEMLDLSAG